MGIFQNLKNGSILALSLGLCALPYLALMAYMVLMHHQDGSLVRPSSVVLFLLALMGGILPLVGIIIIIKRLTRERKNFQLAAILESYASLILIFASWYALLQVGHPEPVFSGMPMLGAESGGASLSSHVLLLHKIFFESMYLSVITITTVGFGDIAPLVLSAKALTAIEGLTGISFMGLVLGHYFSVCIHRKP